MTLQQSQSTLHVHARRGFSLAELAIVLAITAIISAMAIPRFGNSLALRRVEGASRRLVADLALAQRYARATSASQTVVFNANSGKYTLNGVSDADSGAAKYDVFLTQEPYSVAMKSADFGGDGTIIFDGYGVPDSGGSVVITCGLHTRTITVDAETGKATAQ